MEPTEMVSVTKECEISLVVEPLSDTIMGLKVREDGVTKAEFDLASVWDFLCDALRNTAHPSSFVGIERRHYETMNIYRLTKEWLAKKEMRE